MFVISIKEIRIIIYFIYVRVKKFGYLAKLPKLITHYHLAIPEFDETNINYISAISDNMKIKYIILAIINLYNLGIENLVVKFDIL